MNFRNTCRLLVLAAVPVLGFAGLSYAAQMNLDHDPIRIPQTPGIILPGDQGTGALSIVPGDRGNLKIEYRKILFGWLKGDSDKGKPENQNKTGETAGQGMQGNDRDSGLPNSSNSMNQESDQGNLNMAPDQESRGMESPQPQTENPGRFKYIAEDWTGNYSSDTGDNADTDMGDLNQGTSEDLGSFNQLQSSSPFLQFITDDLTGDYSSEPGDNSDKDIGDINQDASQDLDRAGRTNGFFRYIDDESLNDSAPDFGENPQDTNSNLLYILSGRMIDQGFGHDLGTGTPDSGSSKDQEGVALPDQNTSDSGFKIQQQDQQGYIM